MSRIEKIKFEIEKRKLSVLVRPSDEGDCNIDGSSIFNGHTLGASIEKASWHFAMSQMVASLPNVLTAKKSDDNKFYNAANALIGCHIKHNVGENIALAHLLVEDEASKYALEIEALNRSRPSCELARLYTITEPGWAEDDIEALHELQETIEIDSNWIDDDDADSASESIMNFVLLLPQLAHSSDLLPIRKVSQIFEAPMEMDPHNEYEYNAISQFHRAAEKIGAKATVYCVLTSAIKANMLSKVFYVEHIVIDINEITAKFNAMLEHFASVAKQTRHDAESD